MALKYFLTTVCCLSIGVHAGIAQTPTLEKLKKSLQECSSDECTYNTLIEIIKRNYSINTDSLYPYIEKAKLLCNKRVVPNCKPVVDYYRAIYIAKKGYADSAAAINGAYIAQYNDKVYNKDILPYMNTQARILINEGKQNEALELLFNVLSQQEKNNDVEGVIRTKCNIANVYYATGDSSKQHRWLGECEAVGGKDNYLVEKSNAGLYYNLGMFYEEIMNRPDSAEFIIKKGIELSKKAENFSTQSSSLNLLAGLYMRQKKMPLVKPIMDEGIMLNKKVGDFRRAHDNFLVQFDYYLHTNKVDSAIAFAKNAIEQTKLLPDKQTLIQKYACLAYLFKDLKDWKNYAAYSDTVTKLRRSFFDEKHVKELAEYEGKYKLKSKEFEIAEQKLALAQGRNYIIGIASLFALALISSLFMFNNYRRRQKIKAELLQQEEQRQAAAAVQAAEDKERKRIAADLHDNLGAFANAVHYGTELLQKEDNSTKQRDLVNHLHASSKDVITSLRETIWALKKETYTAADCLVRIRNFVHTLSNAYPTIQFEVLGTAPAQQILSNTGSLHLIRIVQEAVANAIKHSEAKNIIVHSVTDNNEWVLSVTDDGKGFDTINPIDTDEHNGLQNMKERAAAAGFALTIFSRLNEGTKINITV